MIRTFDIFLSGMAILFLLPFLLPIVVLLKLTGEGEIFYLQDRVGKNGKLFKLYKFATMLKNSPNVATGTVTVKDDPRILPVGALFRKTKINELPQLINIFFGDMSVIGPRPLTPQTFAAYPEDVQEAIKKIYPGLSGIGSIIFRNEQDILEEPNGSLHFYKEKIAPYKGTLELWYVENNTVINYLKMILITIIVIIFPKSQITWKAFQNLPAPDDELKAVLGYPSC